MQLDVADLGDGWTLTDTSDPSSDAPSPVDGCTGAVGKQFKAAKVAKSGDRSFTKETSGAVAVQLTSSSVAISDASLFDDMHALLRDADFGTCLGVAFEKVISGTASGAQITVGTVDQAEQVVDPGDDTNLQSTGITFPVTVSTQGRSVDLLVSMTFISTGTLGASLLVFGPTDELTADVIAEWGRLLAQRLSA